jgi:DNA-binding NarL/FixJ family response regulator
MLDKGMSNRDIAEELQISEHTVKVQCICGGSSGA